MNPWQHGKKARERSPLARVVGRRPLGRPRRSGSSQLVLAVENNKRGRREPPAFFSYHQICVDSIEEPGPQAARGVLPAESCSGAGPHMYAQNAGVGSSRLPFEMTMPTGSTLILLSWLCPSFFAAIDHPSLIDPALVRGAVCRKAPHVPPSACAVNTRSDNELHKKRLPRSGARRRGMTRLGDRSSCPNATRPLYGRRKSRPCFLNPRCRAQP